MINLIYQNFIRYIIVASFLFGTLLNDSLSYSIIWKNM